MCVCVCGGGGVNSMFIVLMGALVLISMLFMVVFIKCTVCCYTVAPRANFSEEIIKYFELELELELQYSLSNYGQELGSLREYSNCGVVNHLQRNGMCGLIDK